MIYKWFNLFNYADFLATGLVSRSLTLDLPDVGRRTFLITRGNRVSITCDGVFLPIGEQGTIFASEGVAVARNSFDAVAYGIEVDA